MKIKPTVASGARDVKRAADQLNNAVAKTGSDSARTHKAEDRLSTALANEQTLLTGVDSRFTSAKVETRSLDGAHGSMDKAAQTLRALSADERKQRIAEFTPPGTQWPQIAWGDLEPSAQQLQKIADETGKPAAYLFNDVPLLAMPGKGAQSAVDGWRSFASGNIEKLGSTASNLGYSIKTKDSEVHTQVEMKALANTPARSETQLVADLSKQNPTNWVTEGLDTLKHPGEMKTLVAAYLKQAPDMFHGKSPAEARQAAVENMRFFVGDYGGGVPGTKQTWDALISEAAKSLQPG
jgi:hypothetical protein